LTIVSNNLNLESEKDYKKNIFTVFIVLLFNSNIWFSSPCSSLPWRDQQAECWTKKWCWLSFI